MTHGLDLFGMLSVHVTLSETFRCEVVASYGGNTGTSQSGA